MRGPAVLLGVPPVPIALIVKLRQAALVVCILAHCPAALASAYRVIEGRLDRVGSQLRTGDEGAVLLFSSGTTLKVGPNARLRSPRSVQLVLGPSKESSARLFSLLSGRVDVEMSTDQEPTPILLRTAHRATAAIVTGRAVVWSELDRSIVGSATGRVLVSDNGPWVSVKPKQAVVIPAEEAEWSWSELPPAPQVEMTQRVWVAVRDRVAVGGFSWPRVPGAREYDVRLTRLDSEQVVHHEVTTERLLGQGWTRLAPGQYGLRVRANGHLGLSGTPSNTLVFHVIGVQTVPGSYVDAVGVVRVVERYHAKFSFVDGLQMSYGSDNTWNQASASVPLYRQERTSVHFRHPSSNAAVTSWVEPSELTARVDIGPGNARWPDTPLRLDIHLQDSSTQGRETSWRPEIEVRVGLEVSKVAWFRKGGHLWAELAPRQGKGPWVVRVLVRDHNGTELAREFLEVSSRR